MKRKCNEWAKITLVFLQRKNGKQLRLIFNWGENLVFNKKIEHVILEFDTHNQLHNILLLCKTIGKLGESTVYMTQKKKNQQFSTHYYYTV